jgi:hypothetical protein
MNKTDNIIDTYITEMENSHISIAQNKTSCDIFQQYLHIQNEYLRNFSQSTKYKKPAVDNLFLLVNGLNTLTHVFTVILEQTANPKLALDNMKKCIFYYTPFIEQMEENILHDLNVSSNSASIFVYNKTIGTIELTQVNVADHEQRYLMKNIEQLILVHRLLFDFLIKDVTIEEVISKVTETLKEIGTSEAGTSTSTSAAGTSTSTSTAGTSEAGTSEAGTSASASAAGTGTSEKELQSHLANMILFIYHITGDKELDINAKYELIHLYIKNYKKEPEHRLTVASLCKGGCSPRPPLLCKK